MASTTTHAPSLESFARSQLIWVGPLTVVVAALVNLMIRSIAVAFIDVPDDFRARKEV